MKEKEDLFAGLRPPRPPASLREAVLGAASRAPAPPPVWVDRLWENPGISRAWRLAALLLLGAHLVLLWGETDGQGRRTPPGGSLDALDATLGAGFVAGRQAMPTSFADLASRRELERELGS